MFYILFIYIFHSVTHFGISSLSVCVYNIYTYICKKRVSFFLTSALKFHYMDILCVLNQFSNVGHFRCLCYYQKQCCNEYPFHVHNFAQVQVYPWDKFLEVILLIFKSMCICNFVQSRPIILHRSCTCLQSQ